MLEAVWCDRFSYVKRIGGVIVGNVCTYQAGLPNSWPIDPQVSHGDVLQGQYVTVSVRVVACSENTTPRVSIDLSPFDAGPSTLLDDGTRGDLAAGDGIYAGRIPIPTTASLGQHVLTISVEDRGYLANATVPIRVLPISDYPIYLDGMQGDWLLEPSGRVELDPHSAEDPYEGSVCQRVSAEAGGGIRYRYSPQGGLPTSGFNSLTFLLKPILFPPEKVFLQVSSSGTSQTISFAHLGTTLATGQWNEIEIPLSALELADKNMAYVRIYSTDQSSYCIDDVRLVSSVEEVWVPMLSLIIGIGLVARLKIGIEETLPRGGSPQGCDAVCPPEHHSGL